MRWKEKKPEAPPILGDLRWRRFFAWWPLKLGDETRWFETVRIEERFSVLPASGGTAAGWMRIRFMD